jgi:hypothetical protein
VDSAFDFRKNQPHLQLEQIGADGQPAALNFFMCAPPSSERRRRIGTIAVDWHDCAWSPTIVTQFPAATRRWRVTKSLPASTPILHPSSFMPQPDIFQHHENHPYEK